MCVLLGLEFMYWTWQGEAKFGKCLPQVQCDLGMQASVPATRTHEKQISGLRTQEMPLVTEILPSCITCPAPKMSLCNQQTASGFHGALGESLFQNFLPGSLLTGSV